LCCFFIITASESSTVSNPSSPFVRVAVFSVLGSPAGLPFLPVEAGFSALGSAAGLPCALSVHLLFLVTPML
jgi:hypothetical protein